MGIVHYDLRPEFCPHQSKELIAISRSGILAILDKKGRECERYKIPYGASLKIKNQDAVKAGQTVAEWDPYLPALVSAFAILSSNQITTCFIPVSSFDVVISKSNCP